MPFDPANYEGLDRLGHIEKYVLAHDQVLDTQSNFLSAPTGSAAKDTYNLQQAISNTPLNGRLIVPWQGTQYKLNAGVSITQPITIELWGNPGIGTSAFVTSSGATGPFFNVNPGSLQHGIHLKNITLDMSATTGETGFYATNIDNSFWERCFARDGTCGYQLDGVAQMVLRDCFSFNQRTRGFYSSAASNVDIRFDNCIYYQTVGATWGVNAAWDIAQGASFMLIDCEEIRSITGSGNWLNYGINVTSPAATTWLFIVNSWFDAATDGTGANSANSAAMNLTSSAVNVRATNSFFSAATSAGQKQRALRVNGGADHQFVNCTFGGSGVEFATGNCTRMGITNCNFVQQFSDPCITFTGGAAPTLGTFSNNTLQSPSSGIVGSAADATSFHNWTGGMTTDA